MTSSPPFDPEADISSPKKSEFEMSEDQSDLQPWYNEVHPDLFQVLKEIPDKEFPLIANKWRREIRCEDLDYQQRKLLRDERMARVYLNPLASRATPAKHPVDQVNRRERAAFAVLERLAIKNQSEQRLRSTAQIYGVRYNVPESQTTVGPSVKTACLAAKFAPPYTGRHAVLIKPSEAIKGAVQSDHYQIIPKNREAHAMSEAENKLVRKYPTNPLALWRQQRFTSPDGCDYRVMREHVKAARYKAMLNVAQSGDEDKKVGVETTRLWSNYHPAMKETDEEVEEKEEKVDEGPGDVAEEEGTEGQETEKKEKKEKKEAKREGAIFALDENYLEDLIENNKKLREQLAPYVVPQAKGVFFQDPKTDPWYLKNCLHLSDTAKSKSRSKTVIDDNKENGRQRRESESRTIDEVVTETDLQAVSAPSEKTDEDRSQNRMFSKSSDTAAVAVNDIRIEIENKDAKKDLNHSKILYERDSNRNLLRNIVTKDVHEDTGHRRRVFKEEVEEDEIFIELDKAEDGRSQMTILSGMEMEEEEMLENLKNVETDEEKSYTESIREDGMMSFEEKGEDGSDNTLLYNCDLEEDETVLEKSLGKEEEDSNKMWNEILNPRNETLNAIKEESTEEDVTI